MVLELNKVFRNIKYEDTRHAYINAQTGNQYTSVTQFLSKLKEPFDSNFWSKKKAKERNITQEEILEEWKYLKELGNSRGSYLHAILEKLNQRDITELEIKKYCTDLIADLIQSESNWEWDLDTPITNSFQELNKLANLFIEQNEYLIPILQEFVIGDDDLNIAGRFDCLYFNEETNEYQIWDYKTDKKLEYFSKYKKKIKLFNVDDCEYEKYSLQLSLYKYIIEKNTPFKLGDSYIVYFKHSVSEYEIIKAKDYSELLNQVFNEHNWTTYL